LFETEIEYLIYIIFNKSDKTIVKEKPIIN